MDFLINLMSTMYLYRYKYSLKPFRGSGGWARMRWQEAGNLFPVSVFHWQISNAHSLLSSPYVLLLSTGVLPLYLSMTFYYCTWYQSCLFQIILCARHYSEYSTVRLPS